MRVVGNIASDSEVVATASGAITAGKPVIVNADGTVSAVETTSVTEALGTPTVFSDGERQYISTTFDSNSNKVVIAYRNPDNSNYGTAIVATISDTSISFGSPTVFNSGATLYISATFDSNSNKVVIAYRDTGNSEYGTAIVGTVSGTSISFGSEAVYESAVSNFNSATFDSNSNKVVIAYQDQGNSQYGTAIVGTVSGTSISFGSATVFESAITQYIAATFDSNSNKVVIAYRDDGNSSRGTAIVGEISGDSISFGSATVFETGRADFISATFDSSANKVVISFADDGDSQKGKAVLGTVSGTSISFGSIAVFNNAATKITSVVYDTSASKVVIAYEDDGNSGHGTFVLGTVSGTSISFGSETVFESANADYISTTFDSNSNRVVIAYRDKGNSDIGTSIVLRNASTSENLTSENFIGFAKDNVADGAVATIQTANSLARDNIGEPITLSGGTAVVFESATTAKIGSTFDSSNNKIVTAYRDEGNSEHGTAIVGTVSGTDISFGSPTVFESAAVGFLNENSIVFDSNANKVVIVYEDEGNSQYGTAVVGTVSGTSISFGTPVVFESAQTFSTAIAFDSSNNKVVIAYEDQANSEHGTAIVGTVSGTSISFGTATVFNAGDTLNIRAAFDSTNNKVVIAYTDAGNSNQGTAIVGTVSGTSISFGSEAVFDTSTGSKNNLGKSIVFDSNAGKVLISYVDVGDSEHGKAIVGTVSGTSISFGTASTFESAATTGISSVFDSNNNVVVIAYRDDGNSSYGTAVTASISGTSVSFTSPVVFESARADEISLAFDSSNNKAVTAFQDAGNSDNGTAVVISASSSLTIGQTYFVQTDGTLSTSADSPSVIAGTAISGTDLIVKG
jgi:hypothetical protein